jgi:putative oxidoreductase
MLNQINSFILSLDAKTSTGYALIRIFLGLALTIRGWMILLNPDSLLELGVDREYFIWISLVGITHLSGGLLLFFGFLTRIGALVQIPIMISAIFYVHVHTQLMMGGQSLELAVLVLFLLCIYFIYGAGKLSIRSYATNRKSNF